MAKPSRARREFNEVSSRAIAKIESKDRVGRDEWNRVLPRFSVRDILNGLYMNALQRGRVRPSLATPRPTAFPGGLRTGARYPPVLRRAQRKKPGHQSRFLLLQNPNPAAARRMNRRAFS